MNILKKYICKVKLKHRYEKYLKYSLIIYIFVIRNYNENITQKHLTFIHFLICNKIFFKYLNKLPNKDKNALKCLENNLKWIDNFITNDDFIFPLSFDWGNGRYWIKINDKWIKYKSVNRIHSIEGMFNELQGHYNYRLGILKKL